MISKSSIIKPFLEERERWFLWLPVFMGCGIGLYYSWSFEPALWLCIGLPLLAGALLYLLRREAFMPLLVALLAFTVGHLAAKVDAMLLTQPMLDHTIERAEVTGRVMSMNRLPDGFRIWLEDVQIESLLQKDTPKKIRIRVKSDKEIPFPGEWVVMRATLNPLSKPAEPGGFDFRRFAFFQGFGATGYTLSSWHKAEGTPPNFLQEVALFFERVRVGINEKLFAEGKDRNIAVASALISGDQSTIDRGTMQAMRISGISHILSVSGLHITLVAGIVFYVLRAIMALIPWLALQFHIKKVAAFFAILAAMFYTFTCSSPIPAVRSMLMTSLILIAVMVDRRALSMRLVSFAAVIGLLISPVSLFDPSFQLSFGAVMSLIAAFEKNQMAWLNRFKAAGWLGKIYQFMLGSIASSIIASAATLPFILYYFQQVNWYGVITNLIAVPLSSYIIMPMALITALTIPVGLQHWPIMGMNLGIKWMIDSAEFVSNWWGAATYHPAMPFYGLLMVTFGGLWMCFWQKRWRLLGLIPFVLGTLTFLITPRPDVFIAEDGITVGVRMANNHLALRAKNREDFTVQTWHQRNGNMMNDFTSMLNWFDMMEQGGAEDIACKDKICILTRHDKRIAFPMVKEDVAALCDKVDLIIAPAEIPEGTDACPAKIMTPKQAEQRGAYVLYIHENAIEPRFSELFAARPWSSIEENQ